MSLMFVRIKRRPICFERLFGVKVEAFKLALEDQFFMVLLYYRSYSTQFFIGQFLGIDDSRVCRLIRQLEPLLAQVVPLPKKRTLSLQEVESLIVDATEQPIERPKRNQKSYYSWKKKCHTLKTEIRTIAEGRILRVFQRTPGPYTTLLSLKRSFLCPPDTRVFVDAGYQGPDKIHPPTELPYKARPNRPLEREKVWHC